MREVKLDDAMIPITIDDIVKRIEKEDAFVAASGLLGYVELVRKPLTKCVEAAMEHAGVKRMDGVFMLANELRDCILDGLAKRILAGMTVAALNQKEEKK
jgi:hypothetical protein